MQPPAAGGVAGTIEIDPTFAGGLNDLDGFSHIIVIYQLHLVRESALSVVPFLDDVPRGIFATRSPTRPNPIGLSVYRLSRIDGTTLHITGVDAVDGSPVLDIKPYVPAFDAPATERIGWFTGKLGDIGHKRADDRFQEQGFRCPRGAGP